MKAWEASPFEMTISGNIPMSMTSLGNATPCGMIARHEWVGSDEMEGFLQSTWEPEFFAAQEKSGGTSFTVRTGATTGLSIWTYADWGAWLAFNTEMGAKLGEVMAPHVKKMDCKTFGAVSEEAQAAMDQWTAMDAFAITAYPEPFAKMA